MNQAEETGAMDIALYTVGQAGKLQNGLIVSKGLRKMVQREKGVTLIVSKLPFFINRVEIEI